MNQRTELLRGVYLRCIQSHKFKTGCFSFNLVRPLCREEAAMNALIPNVLLRGTQEHPDIASISRHLDELYGATVGTLVRKKGELQTVGFYADYIEDSLVGEPIFSRMTQFLGELLFHPLTENGGFQEAAFSGEKESLINSMRSRINDKRTYAMMQMLKSMCTNEPYGTPRIGEEQDIADVTAQQLYLQYQNILAQSEIEIFYMGREDKQTVAAAFQKALSPLARRTLQRFRSAPTDICVQEKEVTESMELSQSKLVIGLRCAHWNSLRDLASMLVCNVIFGAGCNCKLFRKVREEKSLCYYAHSSYDKYKDIMLISSGISADRYDVAKTEIMHQLEACRQGDFTADELDAAKRLLVSALRTDMDSPTRLDDFYLGQTLLDNCAAMDDLRAEIERVSAQDVCRAAKGICTDTVYFLKGEPSCNE